MALESKTLFHPEVLRQRVRSPSLPEQTVAWQPKLQQWATLLASGRADDFKELALLPDFLTEIFWGLLGYTVPAEAADAYTLSRERHVKVDGKVADAVLGRFQKDKGQFIVVVEGNGTRDPLDRPFTGRRMSAIDQAYRYTINLTGSLHRFFRFPLALRIYLAVESACRPRLRATRLSIGRGL